jgi:hypothetical protein
MAPVPDSSLLTSFTKLLRRTPSPSPSPTVFGTLHDLSPKAANIAARAQNLLPRGTADPGTGVLPPTKINNKAFFALFALIGVGFVVTGIWFFFWAKNGGFYFKQTDWDDYKSTVLRRKGPNGTTLSGATASTKLGGGSIVHGEKNNRSRWGRRKGGKKSVADSRYKDFEDEGSTINGSELSSEMSEIKWKAQAQAKSKDKKKKSRFGRGEPRQVPDEEMDVGVPVEVRDTVRAYRHEKPARVGGLNKESDASAFDGSTNQDTSTAASDLLSNRESTPTNTPTKPKKDRQDNYTGGTGGIRKVVSTSTPAASSFWARATGSASKKNDEDQRIKAEAKKLQDKGRAAQRRDFSFQAGDDASSSGVGGGDEERRARREERRARREAERSQVPGSYYEESELGSELSGDIGTKAYHHPIPGLSSSGGSDYAEERRKRRNGAGYRRDAH